MHGGRATMLGFRHAYDERRANKGESQLRMSRTRCCFCVLIVLVSQTTCIRDESAPRKLTSPLRTYVVELSGARSTPARLIERSTVRATVSNSAGRQIKPFQLFSAGFLDSGFDDAFTKHEWPAENVLAFLAHSQAGATPPSTLTVENNSDHTVACLEVDMGHVVLLFDVVLKFRTTIRLPTLPGGPVAGISAAEIASDGQRTAHVTQRFDRRQQSSAVNYSVIIEKDALRVQAEQ